MGTSGSGRAVPSDQLLRKRFWILRRREGDVNQAPFGGAFEVLRNRLLACRRLFGQTCVRRPVRATLTIGRQAVCTSIKACPESIGRIECVGVDSWCCCASPWCSPHGARRAESTTGAI